MVIKQLNNICLIIFYGSCWIKSGMVPLNQYHQNGCHLLPVAQKHYSAVVYVSVTVLLAKLISNENLKTIIQQHVRL